LEKLERRTEEAFLKYVEGSYVCFLAGDDEQTAKLDEDLLMYLEKDNEVIEAEIEGVSDENGVLLQSVDELGKTIEDLPQRQTRLEELATDIEKFHELVRQLNEQKSARLQKVSEQTTELNTNETKLREKEEQIRHLQNVIDTQGITVEDVRELGVEHAQLKGKIEKVARVKQGHDEKALQSQADLQKSFAKLEALSCAGFNSNVKKLNLMDRYGRKQKTNIELDMDRAHEEKQDGMLGGVDLKTGVIPLLTNRKDDCERQLSEIRVELLKVTDVIESSHATVTDTKGAMKALEEQIQRAEDDFKRVTKQHESTHAVKLEELTSLENKVAALQNPVALEAAVHRCHRQCTELEAHRKRYQDENMMQKRAVLTEINNAMGICAEYREYQDKIIKKVKGCISACDIPRIELSDRDAKKLSCGEDLGQN